MISPTDQQRGLMGWGISILFHLGLVLCGTLVLIHPVQFRVEAAKSSTEVEFAPEPVPVPADTPPAPTLTPTPPTPVPTPLLPVQSAPVPELTEPEIAPTPETTPAPAPPVTLVPARLQSPKTPALPKASPVKEASRASRGAVDARPDELHNEPPEYPEESRVAREQGVVILRVEVSPTGEPSDVRILQSSGYARLDQAARQAIQHWKFHPALVAGIPVSSEADVPVRFELQ